MGTRRARSNVRPHRPRGWPGFERARDRVGDVAAVSASGGHGGRRRLGSARPGGARARSRGVRPAPRPRVRGRVRPRARVRVPDGRELRAGAYERLALARGGRRGRPGDGADHGVVLAGTGGGIDEPRVAGGERALVRGEERRVRVTLGVVVGGYVRPRTDRLIAGGGGVASVSRGSRKAEMCARRIITSARGDTRWGDETGSEDRAHLSGGHPNLARLARRARDERHRARPAPGADAEWRALVPRIGENRTRRSDDSETAGGRAVGQNLVRRGFDWYRPQPALDDYG